MITSQSTNEEILDAVLSEKDKALYWLNKKYNYSQKTDLMCDLIIAEHRRTGLPQHSEPVEYTSRSGNRWCVFLRTLQLGDQYSVQTTAFIYRYTIGSIEIFVPTLDNSSLNGNSTCVMIYTSHFFLRMSQRLGIEKIDRDVVIRLLASLNGFVFNPRGDGKKRKNEVELSIMGTVWRGVYRDDEMHIIEVKTLLRKSELTKNEQQKLKVVDFAQKNAVVHTKRTDLLRIAEEDTMLIAELYDNSFILNVRDNLSIIFYESAGVTKLVADKICFAYSFDDYIQFLINDMKTEKVIWHEMVDVAYDIKNSKKYSKFIVPFILFALRGVGCNMPYDTMCQFILPSIVEFDKSRFKIMDELKDFFVVNDKSMFQSKLDLGPLASFKTN